MASWSEFIREVEWIRLLIFLFSVAASLLCITLHELSHGYAAYCLGDPTAKRAGRLTLNPIKHIDLMGLLMMVVAHVGWAKPVPIDLRNFRKPKRDMALTALAGPASNVLLTYAALLAGHAVYRWGPNTSAAFYVLLGLMYLAVLSLGLGLFNLLPVPPLDGSKILLSFLPDKLCYAILRRERLIALVMVGLTVLGVFTPVLNFLMGHVMRALCRLSGFPYELIAFFYL